MDARDTWCPACRGVITDAGREAHWEQNPGHWEAWQRSLACGKGCLRQTFRRECEECGRRFITDSWSQRFCRMACRQKAHRHVASLKPMDCERCGTSFQPSRSDAVFCGAACKQRAYRQREREGESMREREVI